MMIYSRSEIYNSVRDMSGHTNRIKKYHTNVMQSVTKKLVSTPNWGWKLKPKINWDRKNPSLKFKI